jgi:hypothetical protein
MMKIQFASSPLYVAFQLVFALVFLGWAIVYGYANYQVESCFATTRAQLSSLQARLDKNRTRQESLTARASELADAVNKSKKGDN